MRSVTEMKRAAWIDHRQASGYHWPTMLKAMAQLVVYGRPDGEGLVVDVSAIAPPNAPQQWWLTPGPDGLWSHNQSGETGTLFDVLCSITLTCTELSALEAP